MLTVKHVAALPGQPLTRTSTRPKGFVRGPPRDARRTLQPESLWRSRAQQHQPGAVQASERDVLWSLDLAYPLRAASERLQHLQRLLILRRFYRNCIRAEAYATSPGSVYVPHTEHELAEYISQEDRAEGVLARREAGFGVLADMSIIKEHLEADVVQLLPGAPSLFASGSNGKSTSANAAAQALRTLADKFCSKLGARIEKELKEFTKGSLTGPVPLQVVKAQLKQRKEQVLRQQVTQRSRGLSRGDKFLKSQVPPAVRTARAAMQQMGVRGSLSAGRSYVTELWARLNGQSSVASALPLGLPMPSSLAESSRQQIENLQMRIEKLEKDLRDASKAREQRLRRAPIELRASMAFEMQDMDREVMALSRELALCTLDVQLECMYIALEDELRQVLDADPGPLSLETSLPHEVLAKLALRRGSTEELRVFLAQFALLSQRQAALQDVLERKEKLALLMPAFDDELRLLAEEIAELRLRLGVPDDAVFTGTGVTLRKLQLQLKEKAATARDGVEFFALGMRMLGTDVMYASNLFGRASLGNTLKPREVSALRRTVLDLFTFIPFAIILIIPLTPLGHVLVFGFIQRYFPDFFPSQFNQRRQEMVKRYEALKEELARAQAAANSEEDEQVFKQAAAAIARLSPLSMPLAIDSSRSPDDGDDSSKSLVQASTAPSDPQTSDLKALEKKVEAAGFDAMTFSVDENDDSSSNTKSTR